MCESRDNDGRFFREKAPYPSAIVEKHGSRRWPVTCPLKGANGRQSRRGIVRWLLAVMEKQLSSEPIIRLTPDEYLALEGKAETKSEYLNGEIFPMPGVTREHNLINLNIVRDLSLQLGDRHCEVYGLDMRVKVAPTGLYTYPDVVAVCGEPEFEHRYVETLLNPHLIIEVLSASTESYDRGNKFAQYRKLDSLKEYVLVSQYECRIEQFVRQLDNKWLYAETTDPNGSVELSSVACRLSLSRVYDRIDFDRARAKLTESGP